MSRTHLVVGAGSCPPLPNAHGQQDRQHLPYTSRFMSADGAENITIRPPLSRILS